MTVRSAALALFCVMAFTVAGCDKPDPNVVQGYVEADYIFVTPQVAGRIESLAVDNGAHVSAGEILAGLDSTQAHAQLADAQATLTNAEHEYQRYINLPRGKVVSESAVDLATRNYENAKAALVSAQWNLDQRTLTAPVEGVVDEVLFRQGEVVTAGQAVIRLLAPSSRKVRFYVNEALLPRLKLGTEVTVHCDGCGDGVRAKVSFLAPQAEYTPPVIYSIETRGKLVFMIEAIPDGDGAALNVGMPVSVALPPAPQAGAP